MLNKQSMKWSLKVAAIILKQTFSDTQHGRLASASATQVDDTSPTTIIIIYNVA